MRQDSGPLHKQQALAGTRPIEAPPASFVHDRVVVGLVVETEQTQFESVLPFRLPVTATGIAAGLRQQRLNLVPKRNRNRRGQTRDRHRDRLDRVPV